MRGKAPIWYNRGVKTRITPAYAGKSIHICKMTKGKKDHPRLCGEKLRLSIMQVLKVGSPPPMRGKVYKKEVFL